MTPEVVAAVPIAVTSLVIRVIEWAEAEHKAGRNPEPYVSILLPRVDGSWDGFATGGEIARAPGWELFERIPARFHKLLGILALEREEWAKAISHFDRATELYPEIGVGTRRAQADTEQNRRERAAQGGVCGLGCRADPSHPLLHPRGRRA